MNNIIQFMQEATQRMVDTFLYSNRSTNPQELKHILLLKYPGMPVVGKNAYDYPEDAKLVNEDPDNIWTE